MDWHYGNRDDQIGRASSRDCRKAGSRAEHDNCKIVDEAIERARRDHFWKQVHASYAALTPEELAADTAERELWQTAFAGDLEADSTQCVVVVPLTTRDRGIRHHIQVDHRRAGLDRPSLASCEDLRSIPQRQLTRFLGRITQDDLYEIRETVRALLGY